MNKLLYIAPILDPRQKMKHVEKCLKHIYRAPRASELVLGIRGILSELVEEYKNVAFPPRPPGTNDNSENSSGDGKRQRTVDELKRRSGRGSLSSLRSDSDDDDDDHNEIQVDILKWWSTYGLAYPILSEIARDVLAIPISSVASESAFSMGGRLMNSFRSSLAPNMLEAIVCAEDWLRSADSVPSDEEDLLEHEQELEYRKGKIIDVWFII
ncbi:Putative AC9 transposase [Linum grandiflorum]